MPGVAQGQPGEIDHVAGVAAMVPRCDPKTVTTPVAARVVGTLAAGQRASQLSPSGVGASGTDLVVPLARQQVVALDQHDLDHALNDGGAPAARTDQAQHDCRSRP